MSIRFRLNALVVALLGVALVSFVLAMVISAGPRIHAENESITRLAHEFVETTIASLQGTEDPGARLEVLLDGLKGLRHVRIYRVGEDVPEPRPRVSGDSSPADWLGLMAPPSPKQEIPINVNGQDFGTLVIEPRAEHEAEEIWESIETFTVVGGAMGIATVFFMSLMIAHILKPIRNVGDALLQLDAGRYDVAVPETGPPEIADICRKLNRFAATLERTISENRRLAQRIICVQDEERKELARELHDELGPYLFAIRAAVTVLQTEIERGTNDRTKLLEACAALVERMEMIQRTNRRVLHKLRPMGLEEFGLKAKLGALVALLQESHAGVDITLAVADDLPSYDETSALTIYRLVQEGLTNAVKHASASAIDIAVERAQPDNTPRTLVNREQAIVQVTIADDGTGLPDAVKPGYGIAGMSERVWATGGELRLSSSAGNGVTLEAWIPVSPPGSSAGSDASVPLSIEVG